MVFVQPCKLLNVGVLWDCFSYQYIRYQNQIHESAPDPTQARPG